MRKLVFNIIWLSLFLSCTTAFPAGNAKHVVVVVWDGMRPDFITREHTPTLYKLMRDGVMFENHHSVYCTATEVNGVAIATGAYPDHSGIIANNDLRPDINPLKAVAVQSLPIVRQGDDLSKRQYILCPTVAEILQEAGLKTAIAGSKDIALLHDRRQRADNSSNVTVFAGQTLPASVLVSIKDALGPFPGAASAKSLEANENRDEWTTRALLGPLWTNGVPTYSLLWLSEPDFSQHAAGPGSEKALAALGSSDRKLAEVLNELDRRNLRDKTDVFVVSDHGFSTVERAVDVCVELQKAGFNARREFKSKPERGDVLVIGQGGSVLFYVVDRDFEVVEKLVSFLQQQEFSGVVLTREKMEGTFTMDKALIDSPNPPDVVLSLRWSDAKSPNGTRGMFWSDGGRPPGEGTHASLSKFDVNNTLVADGPDFKKGFRNKIPTGNIDIAPTILWLLGVTPKVKMDGRVLSEALTVDAPAMGETVTQKLEASRVHDKSVWRQYLNISRVNDTIYVDEGNGQQTSK